MPNWNSYASSVVANDDVTHRYLNWDYLIWLSRRIHRSTSTATCLCRFNSKHFPCWKASRKKIELENKGFSACQEKVDPTSIRSNLMTQSLGRLPFLGLILVRTSPFSPSDSVGNIYLRPSPLWNLCASIISLPMSPPTQIEWWSSRNLSKWVRFWACSFDTKKEKNNTQYISKSPKDVHPNFKHHQVFFGVPWSADLSKLTWGIAVGS